MHLLMSLFVAALFVVLTPGILLTLPKKGSKLTVAVVHGLVFAIIYHFTHKAVWHYLYEGFVVRPKPKPAATQAAQAAQATYASAIANVQAAMQQSAADAAALQQAKLVAGQMAAYDKPAALQTAVAAGGKQCTSSYDCNTAPCNTPDGAAPQASDPGICNWNWSLNRNNQ